MTAQPLPLLTGDGEAPYRPCVQSGYCCTQGTCPYGTWDDERARCVHLTEEMTCGIYEYIRQQPGSEWSPAFGAGCSSPGNAWRLAIIRARAGAAVPAARDADGHDGLV